MKKFTEIDQFRNTVREVRTNWDYQGKDDMGEPIYKHDKPYPTLTFRGTVKLHGCVDENTLVTFTRITSLACISWINNNQRHAIKQTFVSQKRTKLREIFSMISGNKSF